jgi:hypothetical protein
MGASQKGGEVTRAPLTAQRLKCAGTPRFPAPPKLIASSIDFPCWVLARDHLGHRRLGIDLVRDFPEPGAQATETIWSGSRRMAVACTRQAAASLSLDQEIRQGGRS